MDFNRETVLDELNDFEKRSNEISPILEEYLQKIAKSGDTMFPWNKLKPLFKRKLELVLTDFYESCPTDNLPPLPNVENFKYDVLKAKILEAVDSFESAPFTIQRLCELVTDPRRHYKRTDKFMRGVEKNILVVSTVEPRSPFRNEVYNNNNASLIVNGLISTTTTNSLQGALTSDDNGNMSPSSVTTTAKSSVNGSIPLDNFANVFSSAPCMTTSTDIHSSTTSSSPSSSHDSFQNSNSVESFSSNENNNNDVLKADRINESRDGQLADSAMDTSPDPSEHSRVLNLYHSERSVDSPSQTSQSSMPESTDDHALTEMPCTQLSQEEPSSSGTMEIFQHKTSPKAVIAEENGDSAVPSGSSDKIVTNKADLQDHCDSEEKEESDQPSYVVSSSQSESNVTVTRSLPDDSVSQSHFRLPDSVESTKTSENDGFSSPRSPSKENVMNTMPPSSSEQNEVSDSAQSCKDMSDSCEAEAMEQD